MKKVHILGDVASKDIRLRLAGRYLLRDVSLHPDLCASQTVGGDAVGDPSCVVIIKVDS